MHGRRSGRGCAPRRAERAGPDRLRGGLRRRVRARRAAAACSRWSRRWRPDVIVRETCEFASLLAADAIGVPDVHVACFLAGVRRSDWGLRRAAGPPAAGVRLPRRRDRGRAVPDARAARARGPGHPAGPGTRRFRAPRRAARPLPDWWDGSRQPLVYVSFGSAAAGNGFFPEVYRDAVDALADAAGARAADARHRGRPAPTSAPCPPTSTSSAGCRRARSCRTRRRWSATAARARRWWRWPPGCRSRSCRCSPTSPRTPRRVAELGAGLRARRRRTASPTRSARCSTTRPTARRARAVADEIAAHAAGRRRRAAAARDRARRRARRLEPGQAPRSAAVSWPA